MSKFGKYVQESYDELIHKVTWPKWNELQQSTIIVLVALLVITLILLGMNGASEFVMKLIYGV
ncbi:MAG: preprotein translocase subunit SecE [Bacteroidetes bacterium 47-18]|nr:MAG: preprotein translocase subunit SecE [Bacteroidetes bacterium 47-18]